MGLTIIRAGQSRHATFGNDSLRITEANADSVTSWWLSGGISPTDVAAVWTPKGKGSLALSYVRDAGDQGNVNIDPAIVGGVAPTFNTLTGWTGNGTTQYLKTGVIPAAGWSAFVHFASAGNVQAVFGSLNAAITQFFQILPRFNGVVSYGNGGFGNIAPDLTSGTLALAGQVGYRNGRLDVAISAGTVPSFEVYLLGRNYAGALNIPFAGSLAEIAFYKATITAAQVLYLDTRVTSDLYTRNYVFDGDSLTEGIGAPAGSDYPSQVMTLLGSNPLYKDTNDGLSGAMLTTMITDAAARIDPLYLSSFTKNILCIWGGTNDIALNNKTAAETYANMITYCNARRAVGWKVAVFTILPRVDMDATEEAYRISFNTSVRTNWATFADALVDVGADSRIGDPGDYTDLTYYDAGGVHLNATGYGVVADLAYTQISGL